MGFIIMLFIVIVVGCWLLFRAIGKALFTSQKQGYIDRSVHHHHYDNRSIYMDGKEYKNLKK